MGVTLVTGASSGIGRSLARRLAADGSPVALLARRKPLLESLVQEIEALGGRALAIPCDVTERARVHEAVRAAEAELGAIECLVANAGGGGPTSAEALEAGHVDGIFRLNVLGVVHCIEAVLPAMLARGSGHLVAVSSLAAWRGLPGAGAYCAAKAALGALMESLRLDLAPRGVRVTLLSPGFVRTRTGPRAQARRRRPLEMELEDATRRMHRAIRARRRAYAFPLPLALAVAVGRLLPAALYDSLLAGRGRRPRP